MHKYRTHKCNELRIENVNDQVKLSGWVHRKRDHGQLIFVDLRDHYGLTQVVVDSSNKNFSIFESLPLESVITVSGIVVERSNETINDNLPTCLLYTSPSPRDTALSRMPSSALKNFFLMIRRPPRSTHRGSSAASDVYKRQV